MNVLMYCLSSVSGGAVAYLRNLAPLLAERFARGEEGHSLKFLAHEEQALLLAGVEDSQICWVRGARPTGARRVLWERRNVARLAREAEADVLFTPYQIGPRVAGTRQVLMIRNMEPFLFGDYPYSARSWLRNFVLQQASVRALRRAERVIAVSGFAEDYLRHGIGMEGGGIRTIYHGRSVKILAEGDARQEREMLGRLGVGERFILTCGGLFPYRRCEDVIEAFNRCEGSLGKGMQLVIAGTGTDRRYGELLRRVIADSPVRERILTVGHVPWETMGTLYRRCAACVIATEIEACPNIAIEAMAAGCVIVSSDRPPLPEMFAGCSLEYPARKVEALAERIKLAVENETLRREKRELALERAQDFSWERCAGETYAALTQWP